MHKKNVASRVINTIWVTACGIVFLMPLLWMLYGTCLLWALSDLCNLIPMPDWKPQLPKKGEDHDPA